MIFYQTQKRLGKHRLTLEEVSRKYDSLVKNALAFVRSLEICLRDGIRSTFPIKESVHGQID